MVAVEFLDAAKGKLGQLYVQEFPDGAAVAAVDQYETLASSLSEKVWQKLMILDRFQAGAATPPPPPRFPGRRSARRGFAGTTAAN
jgi:hypothetical protein